MATNLRAASHRRYQPRYRRVFVIGGVRARVCGARACAARILGYVVVQGVARDQLRRSSRSCRMPVGETGRRRRQRHRRHLIIVGLATLMAMPLGVLTGIYPRAVRPRRGSRSVALSLRRALGHSEHRDRSLRLHAARSAVQTFLGALGVVRVHDADAAADDAHVGRGGAQRAADGSRRRAGAGHVGLSARRCTSSLPAARPAIITGAAAGDRARHRRDGAAALHRVRQPVLGGQSDAIRWRSSPLQVFNYAISPYRRLAPRRRGAARCC